MSESADPPILTGDAPDARLKTFRHYFARACACYGHRYATREHVLEQAAVGGATCDRCRERSDLREALRQFGALGQPESLFGLDVFTIHKKIPALSSHQVIIVDPELSLPYEGTLVYANVTPQAESFDEAPWLLAPQSSYQPWGLYMRFHVPPGGERALTISFAVKPAAGLEEPLELALQAVDAFHRQRFSLASLLLAASVEATLRPLCEAFYLERQVKLPEDLGFAALLERARLLFEPQLGSQLIGHLKDLAKRARNPAAHGRSPTIPREDVASWMVDVAVLFEWARVARSIAGHIEPT